MKTWKERAQEALKAGYVRGNPWEGMLERHLRRLFPSLVTELQNTREFGPYLVVMTWNAMKTAEFLEGQGTPPDVAEELAREQLLAKPPEEQDFPHQWEVEGAQEDAIQAARHYLSSLAGKKKP